MYQSWIRPHGHEPENHPRRRGVPPLRRIHTTGAVHLVAWVPSIVEIISPATGGLASRAGCARAIPPVSRFGSQGGPPLLKNVPSIPLFHKNVATSCAHGREELLPSASTAVHFPSTMWRLSLYILYATTLFSLVSAWSPLNSCILGVQASKPWQVTDARGILKLGTPMLLIR